MTRLLQKTALLVATMLMVGCASAPLRPPSSLTGNGRTYYYVNEALIALDTVADTAIALNKVTVCDPTCHQLVAESDARVIVQSIRNADAVLAKTTDGWPAVSNEALRTIEFFISPAAKDRIGPYLRAAHTVLDSLEQKQRSQP